MWCVCAYMCACVNMCMREVLCAYARRFPLFFDSLMRKCLTPFYPILCVSSWVFVCLLIFFFFVCYSLRREE